MNNVKRIHILILSLILAAAAVAGLSAVSRTVHLGASARTSQLSAAQVARQSRRLAHIERALHAQTLALTRPHAARAATQPVIYVRPKPIVHVVHRAHGDDGEGGSDD